MNKVFKFVTISVLFSRSTPILSEEILEGTVKRDWESAGEEVRTSYGERYRDEFKVSSPRGQGQVSARSGSGQYEVRVRTAQGQVGTRSRPVQCEVSVRSVQGQGQFMEVKVRSVRGQGQDQFGARSASVRREIRAGLSGRREVKVRSARYQGQVSAMLMSVLNIKSLASK